MKSWPPPIAPIDETSPREGRPRPFFRENKYSPAAHEDPYQNFTRKRELKSRQCDKNARSRTQLCESGGRCLFYVLFLPRPPAIFRRDTRPRTPDVIRPNGFINSPGAPCVRDNVHPFPAADRSESRGYSRREKEAESIADVGENFVEMRGRKK